jgi:hypothetical protein
VSGTQSGGTGGSLGLTILNSSQTILASGSSTSGTETLTVSLTSGSKYYIEVNSPSGSLFSYTLTMTSASTGKHHGGKPGMLLAPVKSEVNAPVKEARVASAVASVATAAPPWNVFGQAAPQSNAPQSTTTSVFESKTLPTGQTPIVDPTPQAPAWSYTSLNAAALTTASVPAKPLDDGFWLNYPDDWAS